MNGLFLVALGIIFFEFLKGNHWVLGSGVIPFAVKVRLLATIPKIEILKASKFFRCLYGPEYISIYSLYPIYGHTIYAVASMISS